MGEWRVGRKLGRTLYRDEVFVGLIDSPELAAEIVETMNRVGQLLDEVRVATPESGRERSHRGSAMVCPTCRDLVPRGRFDTHGQHPRAGQPDLCLGFGEDLRPLGLSRVDPYDSTKGGVTRGD